MSNVPKLRFSEFGGEWEEKKLGEVCEIIMGQSPSSNSYNSDNNGVPLIQGNADIQNRLSNPRNYTTEKTKECKIGDLILTVRAPVGAIAKSIHNACIGRGVCAIRNNTKSTNEFIYQFLLDYETKWSSLEQGSTFTAVSGIEIKKLKIKLPCIDEQTKISNFLSSIDKKIEQLTQKQSLLQEYKKGVMQKIFSQEIRFKADDGSEFPEWEEKKLGEVIEFLSDYTANGSFASLKENVTYYNDENYAVLVRTTDLEKKVFNPERYTDKQGYDFLKKTSLYGGEIILANVGSIGKVYRVPKYHMPMTLAPNTYVLKFNNDVNEAFIFQLMLRTEFKNKLLSMVGSSTLQAINKGNLRSIDIEIPLIKEQTKIANFLSSIDKKIEMISQTIEKAKEFKKGLLQQMFV